MTNYYCPTTELMVYKGEQAVSPERIKDMRIKDLLEHKVKALGIDIDFETKDGKTRFLFLGADAHLTFDLEDSAEKALRAIIRLGSHYDTHTGQFYF